MSFQSLTTSTTEEVLQRLETKCNGLVSGEAAERLKKYGPNELAKEPLRWQTVLVRQFASPFVYLLAAAAVLAFFLGELVDAVMIAAFVLINAGLGFAQEYHSERSVEKLRGFVVAKSRVWRDGKETVIDSRALVPGDVVVVETGDVIHADVRLLQTDELLIDESVLTGESEPTRKRVDVLLGTEALSAHQAANIGFTGTTVVSGRGVGVVFATGSHTEMGDISRLTSTTNDESAFEASLKKFSVMILRVIVVTLILVFVANLFVKGDAANIPDLLIFSIALAVSVIPEALPVVITLTLSRGALRLAKNRVVVKRLSAIEDLGSVDVLCTDKTGTITENKMAVSEVFGADAERCVRLAGYGASFSGGAATPNNAFDLAVWNRLPEVERSSVAAIERSHEVPFDPARRMNSVVVREDGRMLLVVRGAPEELMALCTADAEVKKNLHEWTAKQGRLGRRVLAVATRFVEGEAFHAEDAPLVFGGCLSFEDPLKSSAKEAIERSKALGVQVKILTGDSAEVAGSIAQQVGLISGDHEVMTGQAWTALSHEAQLEAVETHAVFARVSPREKYLIIEALKHSHTVAFLGEGINDAPALKMAHVGIVVDGASDVAREAADIVLLDHALGVVVSGIREGREVFANTVKYIKATLASNFGNFLAVAVSTLLVDFLPMLPLQLLLVNLLSDFPMIAIATDRVDESELTKPRSYDLREIVNAAWVFGLVSTVFDFIFFALFSRISPEVLHTNWFIGSILTELVLIFAIRTRKPWLCATRPSNILLWLSGTAAVVTVVIPYTSIGRNVFHLLAPTPQAMGMILGIVAIYFMVTEYVKRMYYKTAT